MSMDLDFGSDEMRVMDLPNSIVAVQLLTPEAVYFERRGLGIAPGFVSQEQNVKHYVLRNRNNQTLVLIEVRDGAVTFCRTTDAKRPKAYISSIVEFIIRQDFDIAADMASTGIVREKGHYYSIYELPKGFIYNGNMDLSYADLKQLPDMSHVTIKGDYNISGNDLFGLYGSPKHVYGNYYAWGRHPHKGPWKRPRNTIIGGSFITVRPKGRSR